MLQANNDVPKYCHAMEYLGVTDHDLADAEIQLSKINLINWAEKSKTFSNEVSQFKDPSL